MGGLCKVCNMHNAVVIVNTTVSIQCGGPGAGSYHHNPADGVQEDGGVVLPHQGHQQPLVGLHGPARSHADAAHQLAAVAVLAPGIQGQQRHEGGHLEQEVHQHGQGGVQSEGLDRRHGGQSPWERNKGPRLDGNRR